VNANAKETAGVFIGFCKKLVFKKIHIWKYITFEKPTDKNQ
jgi:hypothetical protein